MVVGRKQNCWLAYSAITVLTIIPGLGLGFQRKKKKKESSIEERVCKEFLEFLLKMELIISSTGKNLPGTANPTKKNENIVQVFIAGQ